MTDDHDFRGIAISSLLSKVYESCIYNRFQCFFYSPDNQFGFKTTKRMFIVVGRSSPYAFERG